MNDLSPVYSSRIIRTYLEYLREEHPGLNPEPVLEHAGMTRFQVQDQGHWFNQRQVDRFQQKIVDLTGNPDLAREAGRFAASAKGLGYAKQIALGLTSLSSGYRLIAKLAPLLSRGAEVKATRLGATHVEIVSRPVEGIHEKPYQCKNRMGYMEALGKMFTQRFPEVEHPECFHRGDEHCRYIIRWKSTPSIRWRAIRNYSLLLGLVVSLVALFTVPLQVWLTLSLVLTGLVAGVSSYAQRLGSRELVRLVESQGEEAREHIEGMSERYNNTLLVQEIGQATSRILDREHLVNIIASNMERHLGYDRGMIILKQGSEGPFRCVAEYGYNGVSQGPARNFTLHLRSISSPEAWVWTSNESRPQLEEELSFCRQSPEKEGEELGRRMGVASVLGVPILYEGEVLGFLAVGNVDEHRVPTQSDLGVLRGVASQVASSLSNASSFQKLQESEERYRNILEAIEEAYFEVDLAGHFAFFNDSLCRITGYSRSELLGMSYRNYSTPETARKMYEVFSRVYRTEESANAVDCEIARKDGSKSFIELSASVMRGSSGQPVGFRGIVRDVTERIDAEKKNKMLEGRLRQSQKLEAIGTLAGGIAHDFNNILAAIIGYAELASLASPEDTGNKRHLKEILRASHRARDLVKQILAFSRHTESERVPIELGLVVKEALKLLRASLPTTIEIRQNLEACGRIIEADPTQMHQVLMNLCTNAHHAMQHTGGILDVRLRPFDGTDRESGSDSRLAPGAYLSLEVRDTGPGIDAQILDRIFEPFFTTKGPGQGTGMGLAVVHGIVKSHGGAVEVDTQPGRGTTFRVLLPCINGRAKRGREASASFPLGRGRILFVDDEPALADLAKQLLERLGYEVEPRTSPTEALEAFRTRPEDFNLVITDKTMPNMTGFGLAEEVRRIRSDIPIILCTGLIDSDDATRSDALGITRTLVKPLSVHALATAVREVLDGADALDRTEGDRAREHPPQTR